MWRLRCKLVSAAPSRPEAASSSLRLSFYSMALLCSGLFLRQSRGDVENNLHVPSSTEPWR
jgi:hypothetical protein